MPLHLTTITGTNTGASHTSKTRIKKNQCIHMPRFQHWFTINPLGVVIMTTSLWSQFPTFCRTPILPSVYKDYILFYEKKSWVKWSPCGRVINTTKLSALQFQKTFHRDQDGWIDKPPSPNSKMYYNACRIINTCKCIEDWNKVYPLSICRKTSPNVQIEIGRWANSGDRSPYWALLA